MNAVQVSRAGGDFELVERDVPAPGPEQVSIRVSALRNLPQRSIMGWYSGHARVSEDTLNFSVLRGVLPRIEVFPLEKVNEAYERMLSNQARFRVVLKMAGG